MGRNFKNTAVHLVMLQLFEISGPFFIQRRTTLVLRIAPHCVSCTYAVCPFHSVGGKLLPLVLPESLRDQLFLFLLGGACALFEMLGAFVLGHLVVHPVNPCSHYLVVLPPLELTPAIRLDRLVFSEAVVPFALLLLSRPPPATPSPYLSCSSLPSPSPLRRIAPCSLRPLLVLNQRHETICSPTKCLNY